MQALVKLFCASTLCLVFPLSATALEDSRLGSKSFIGAIPDFDQPSLGLRIPLTETKGSHQSPQDLRHANEIFSALTIAETMDVDAYGVLNNLRTSDKLIVSAISRIQSLNQRGIVFTAIAPLSPIVCNQMRLDKNFIFVLTGGFAAKRLEDFLPEACDSPNILFSAPLSADKGQLLAAANFGRAVDFAAPSMDLGSGTRFSFSPLTESLVCSFANLDRFMDSYVGDIEDLPQTFVEALPQLQSLNGWTNKGRYLPTCLPN
ncbi:MAG: hypothetical protein HRU19_17065 [Pseudobacteriovorax sp.]|nr:hypothetical protein [Pseudobacteriovorax sp.]